jgi:iron complex outermembrane receptor protein
LNSHNKLFLNYVRHYNTRLVYDSEAIQETVSAGEFIPDFKLTLTTHSTDLKCEHTVNEKIHGTFGVSGMLQGNTREGRDFIPNFDKYAGGIFLVENYSSRKWEFETGLRYDLSQLNVYVFEGDSVL